MSEFALELITEEKKERTGRLDLSRMKLTVILENILELGHLEYLSLSSNKISDYSYLEKLTSLQSLDLSYGKLTNSHSGKM